jgi:hypothetical protein
MNIDSRYRQEGFLGSVASQPALGPAQSAVRLVFDVKRPDHEAEPSLPSNVKVKNEAAYTPTPLHVFMACCLNKHGRNLSLALVNGI